MARLLRLPAVYDKQTGALPVGRTPFYEHYVLRQGGPENIPGTNVRRIPLIALGPKARAADEAEVNRVIRQLADQPAPQPWRPQKRDDRDAPSSAAPPIHRHVRARGDGEA